MKDAAIYCPARIDETLFKAAQDMAKRAYRAMNCSGMTRVDMFVTPQRTIIFTSSIRSRDLPRLPVILP